MEEIDDTYESEGAGGITDLFEKEAYWEIERFFYENKASVFYGRQLEVLFEDRYFHWVTNRTLRLLVEQRIIVSETRQLKWGGNVTLYWQGSFRYYKREAQKVIDIVERYSIDKVGSSIGHYGELLVVEGFAKIRFLLLGRNVSVLEDKKWEYSGHNLDMVVERDGVRYGVEVKNTLRYMDKGEFEAKIKMCKYFGVRPVFVVRMLPKSWVQFLIREGGFALILKYQLYPEILDDLALSMKTYLRLPVDTPKSLYDGTMKRFENWHMKHVNLN